MDTVLDGRDIVEVLIRSCVYAGFPAAREVLAERAAGAGTA